CPSAPARLCPFPTRRSSDLRAELLRIGNAPGVRVEDVVAAISDDRLVGFAGDAERHFIARAACGAERFGHALLGKREAKAGDFRSEEHTSELQSRENLVCRR